MSITWFCLRESGSEKLDTLRVFGTEDLGLAAFNQNLECFL